MNDLKLNFYQKFRNAMLSGTDAWQDMIAGDIKLFGPLAQSQGKDAFIAINKPFFQSIKSSELLKVVSVDNFIITQIRTEVVLPNGKTIHLEVSEWYEIDENKIQSLRVYFDTANFKKELGIL